MSVNLSIRIALLALSLTGSQVTALAQISEKEPNATKENSPFSRYGIGNLSNPVNTQLRGLGGGATAYRDGYSVNAFNPASYSFLHATSFDFAIEGRRRSVINDQTRYGSGTATLGFINIGIPLGKNLGMNLGFEPISNVYYNAGDTLDFRDMGQMVANYSGNGGLQQAFLGFSGRYKGLSLGFNLGYTFGNIESTNSLYGLYADSAGNINLASRSVRFHTADHIGGLNWKGGIMYHKTFKNKLFLDVGATATLSQHLNVKRDHGEYAYHYLYTNGGEELIIDTLNHVTDQKGRLQMPAQYSFGAYLGKGFNWRAGVDIVYSDWSDVHRMNDRLGIGQQAWRIAAGGEVTPNPEASSKNYFSLVTYRLGFHYGKEYVFLNATDLNYVGATIGATFPLKRNYDQFGRLNTALEIGQRGNNSNGLPRETVIRFTVGISFNDIWFKRFKYQ